MLILPYAGIWPKISEGAYIAENATIVGEVTVGEESSVWFGAVVRAEGASIKIGKRSNIQDNCVIHAHPGQSLSIGDDVSIAHGARIHGSRIGSNSSIGMGTIMLTGSSVGENCEIGAGIVIFKDVHVPDNTLLFGKFETTSSEVTTERSKTIKQYAEDHRNLARNHLTRFREI